MDVVGPKEESLKKLALGANRNHLAAGIHKLIGVVRNEVEVQTVLRELGLVEGPPASLDRDVAGRQFGSRQCPWIKRHRKTWSRQAGREARLPGRCSVGRQSVKPVHKVPGDRIGSNLGVIHGVAGANRRARIAARMPSEAEAAEISSRVSQVCRS